MRRLFHPHDPAGAVFHSRGEDQNGGGSLMPGERQQTRLAVDLTERIGREGPIPVEAYMRTCLHDPEHGYYRGGSVIGADCGMPTGTPIRPGIWVLVSNRGAIGRRGLAAMRATKLIEL